MRGAVRIAIAAAVLLAAGTAAHAGTKGLKLKLRAAPRVAPVGTAVIFTADLSGGEDGEDLYCLTEEWRWDDGSVSTKQGECPDYAAGQTPVERMFSADRTFTKEGKPTVTLVLRKGDRTLARSSVSLAVAPKKENSFELHH